jgi:glycosyltransferase 2 family protein
MKKETGLLLGRLALGLAVVALCALLGRSIDWHAVAEALRGADLRLVALAALINFIHLGAKSERLRVMLAPLRRIGSLKLYYYLIVGCAASIVLPGRAGEGLRVYLLHRREQVPVYASLGVIVVEKLFEGLGLMLVVLPLPFMLPLPEWANLSIGLVALVGISGTLAVLFFAWRAQVVAQRNHAEMAPRWARFGAGMECVRRPSLFAAAIGWSAVGYALDLVEVYLILHAVGVVVPWPAAGLVLLAVNLAIAVPSTPGQLGAFEAGAVAGLRAVGVELAPALAFALVYHVMQVAPVLLAGLSGLRELSHPVQDCYD